MDTWAYGLLIFGFASLIVIVVAIIISQQVSARVSLPGKAEFYIKVDKGWRRVPDSPHAKQPRRQRKKKQEPARAERLPRFRLVAKVRGGPDWEYPLDGKQVVYIGRRDDNDIILRDETADTRQAVIYWEKGRYRINNLSRDVPTRVNDRPITWQNLGNGNTIQMGRTKLIFRERK